MKPVEKKAYDMVPLREIIECLKIIYVEEQCFLSQFELFNKLCIIICDIKPYSSVEIIIYYIGVLD